MKMRKLSAALVAGVALVAGNEANTLRAEDVVGNDQPRLEITQTPLEPAGPGKPFALDICVRNLGSGIARSIHVTEKLPDGAELIEAAPVPARQQDILQWSLATLKPGEEYHLRLRLRADSTPPTGQWPNAVRVAYQGEVGNVHFIDLKRPRIELSFVAPKYALLGETIPVEIIAKNSGTWPGHRLALTATITGGLSHEAGTELENEIGDLAAGKACSISLPLSAIRTGKGYLQLRLNSEEGGPLVETVAIDIRDVRADLVIHGPASVAGPGWPCTYDFVLNNQGSETLPASKLVAEMPKNVNFLRASGNVIYEGGNRTVTWEVPECKPGESVTCALSGVSQDSDAVPGRLVLIHNKFVVKSIPWTLRVIDRSAGTPAIPTTAAPAPATMMPAAPTPATTMPATATLPAPTTPAPTLPAAPTPPAPTPAAPTPPAPTPAAPTPSSTLPAAPTPVANPGTFRPKK